MDSWDRKFKGILEVFLHHGCGITAGSGCSQFVNKSLRGECLTPGNISFYELDTSNFCEDVSRFCRTVQSPLIRVATGTLPQVLNQCWKTVQQTMRMTVLFFALSGLDLLDGLQEIDDTERKHIIDWIYSLQILPGDDKDQMANAGFRGGTSLAGCRGTSDYTTNISFDCGHITMTYTALASLIILGDDLSRVNRKAVLAHVAALQCQDGSFYSTRGGSENDMRFMYCAATICFILQDFSAININAAVQYIINSMVIYNPLSSEDMQKSYEGAMGQGIYLEAHGGSSYCAVATLHLMGKLDLALSNIQKQRLVRWLVGRQIGGGLQGRPNKPPDTCYTFWIGASLKLLGGLNYLDLEALRQFVLSTQDPITGGLAKYPESHPDGLHTYLGISGLSLLSRDNLRPVDPALNISQRALKHLHTLHKSVTENSNSSNYL